MSRRARLAAGRWEMWRSRRPPPSSCGSFRRARFQSETSERQRHTADAAAGRLGGGCPLAAPQGQSAGPWLTRSAHCARTHPADSPCSLHPRSRRGPRLHDACNQNQQRGSRTCDPSRVKRVLFRRGIVAIVVAANLYSKRLRRGPSRPIAFCMI
jgi:hypothetical protein